jgi:hypothetical protein
LVPTFSHNEKLGIYIQFYNFESDETTHKPDGTIDYEIVKLGANATAPVTQVFAYSEAVKDVQGGGASQVVVEKLLPLSELAPGQYKLTIKATDKLRADSKPLTQTATFTVN